MTATIEWTRPADQVRSAAEQQYARIRNTSRDLNPEGLRRAMAKVWVAAADAMDKLGGDTPAKHAAAVAAAQRAVFGIDDITGSMTPAEQAATSMAFRDAQQRAAAIDNAAQARALLDQAAQTGDELLARAVGNYCLNNGYVDLSESYLSDRPAKRAALNELQNLNRPAGIATMWEYVTPTPPELSALSQVAIRTVAAS
jgi:hypothetical protein